MPDFTFVNADAANRMHSRAVRSAIRSQAARSALPKQSSDEPASKKRTRRAPYRTVDLTLSTDTLQDAQADSDTSVLSNASREASSVSSHSSIPREPPNPVLMGQPVLSATFSPLLTAYYMSNLAVDIPELDLDTPGLLRSRWFPFALDHPGLIHVILLTSGASFCNFVDTTDDDPACIRQCLAQLKGLSLQLLQKQISNQDGPASDGTVATVLKMASYEAMFGSPAAFHAHMKALQTMITARGGMQKLGLDGLLARMVSWVDCNSAFLLKGTLYFQETGQNLPKPMTFSPRHFIGFS